MGGKIDYILFGSEHGSGKKWYYVLGALSIVLGLISLRCEFYLRFLENDPVESLEELGGHGLMTALTMFFVIGVSVVGIVLSGCALYKRVIIVGLIGLIINLTFLTKTIVEIVSAWIMMRNSPV